MFSRTDLMLLTGIVSTGVFSQAFARVKKRLFCFCHELNDPVSLNLTFHYFSWPPCNTKIGFLTVFCIFFLDQSRSPYEQTLSWYPKKTLLAWWHFLRKRQHKSSLRVQWMVHRAATVTQMVKNPQHSVNFHGRVNSPTHQNKSLARYLRISSSDSKR